MFTCRFTLFVALLILTKSVFAETLMVEKQRFSLPEFTTTNGKTIQQLEIGWESYGELNSDKSNAILITHYFTGSSHAAGKYNKDDEQAGYWDAIIGPGKAIDTNKYFVISSDTLVNSAPHDKNVITTGPASINPETGKQYGLSFPIVTIRDFVEVQKALIESLGIKKLYAVVGPSMGSFQAIEWASAYPDKVERLVSVIGAASFDAWSVIALEQWANPIRLDPNWQYGNYYDSQAPTAGLEATLSLITLNALYPDFINQLNESSLPRKSDNQSSVFSTHPAVEWIKGRAKLRAQSMDANHILYLVRACQLFINEKNGDLKEYLNRIQAKTLFLPAKNDLLLMPELARDAHQAMMTLNKDSTLIELDGPMGHLDGLTAISQASEQIRSFLAE